MNDNDSLKAENKRLSKLVEEYRKKEVEELRQRLAEAEAMVEHYRAEAQRNADVGRQISSEYEKKINELKGRVETYERAASPRSVGTATSPRT
jgi:2',3'-cyclic-nucleotide 2'-phosphodiesterase (5'-nucleotidase family)